MKLYYFGCENDNYQYESYSDFVALAESKEEAWNMFLDEMKQEIKEDEADGNFEDWVITEYDPKTDKIMIPFYSYG